MRKTTGSTFVLLLLVLSGCGGGSAFANRPKPPPPINLTVYINDSMVSVSPNVVGAGEVVFIVTNQASTAQSLSIRPTGRRLQLASTGPINPDGTSQVAVDFNRSGIYTVTTSAGGATDAAVATPRAIRPALLRVGPPRSPSHNQLLQP